MEKTRIKKLGVNALKVIISIVLLYLVFRKIAFQEIAQIIKKVRWGYLFLAAIFFLASQLLSAKRLENFLHTQGFALSFRSNLELYFLGMFYNFFIPGGIGGDAYKVYILKKKFGWSGKRITSALFNDRLSGLLAILMMILGLLALLVELPFAAGLVVGSFILGVAAYFIITKIFPVYKPIYFISLLYSLLVQSMQVICFILLIKSLGMNDNSVIYAVTFLASSVLSLISFAGIGVREMMFLQASKFFNYSASISVSASLLFSLITICFSFLGIYFQLRKLNLTITHRS